jgi:hypothetical protein
MSKRLLIVGNGNHQFIYNYVKWLKKEGNFSIIDILTDRKVNDEYSRIYSKIYSFENDSNLYKMISKLKGIRRYYRFYLYGRLIKDLSKYDYVHIHYMSVDHTYLANQFKTTPKIITIWGSDYYRSDVKQKEKLIKACKKADTITFTNKLTKQEFEKSFEWDKDNIKICRFGLAPLEILENLYESRIKSKELLGWDKNKTAITVGYNLSEGQQHIEILQQLLKLKEYKQDIELILPITYGGSKDYKKRLLTLLDELDYSYKYYDEFLDDITVCRIRNASEIMIQLQTTDQFSGSMQEYLFTRNVVITGSWLPYKTMKDIGIKYIEIDNVSELAYSLSKVITNFNDYYSDTERNPEAVLKLSSWQLNIKDWLALYC